MQIIKYMLKFCKKINKYDCYSGGHMTIFDWFG